MPNRYANSPRHRTGSFAAPPPSQPGSYTLLYQGGFANVYRDRGLVLLFQSAFGTAESFARGLREAGAVVRPMWANVSGDARLQLDKWRATGFASAPFATGFPADLVPKHLFPDATACACQLGFERDNCPRCEGTGWEINFDRNRGLPV